MSNSSSLSGSASSGRAVRLTMTRSPGAISSSVFHSGIGTPATSTRHSSGWFSVPVTSKPSLVRNRKVGCSPEWNSFDAWTGRPRRSRTFRSTSDSESGAMPAAMSPIRTEPPVMRTRVSAVTQYRIAAGGSSSIEPKLPWPSTSGARSENSCAIRTSVS